MPTPSALNAVFAATNDGTGRADAQYLERVMP